MIIRLKNRGCIIGMVLVAMLLVAPFAPADESGTGLGKLDVLVDRWMALRTTIAEEGADWKEREGQWKAEISLLEREAETLKKEINAGDSFATSVEERRSTLLARKERTEEELHKLRSVLGRAEDDLRRWRKRIPSGMRLSLSAGFDALPETQKDADKLLLTKRSQNVAALYAQIEALQNQIHSQHETLDVNGMRRQVDILYIGLARAFAVSPGNGWAAVGIPTDDGWAWTTRSEEAMGIRHAIEVLNRQETAQLAVLPLQVVGEVQR